METQTIKIWQVTEIEWFAAATAKDALKAYVEWTHRPETGGADGGFTWNPIRARNKETGKVGTFCTREFTTERTMQRLRAEIEEWMTTEAKQMRLVRAGKHEKYREYERAHTRFQVALKAYVEAERTA